MTTTRLTFYSLLAAVLFIASACTSDRGDDGAASKMKSAMNPDTPTPAMQNVLDHLAKLGGKPIETLSPEEARQQPTPADAVKAIIAERDGKVEPEAVGGVKDQTIPGPAGAVPVRIYTPKGNGPFPAVLYIHGGGFVIATIDTYDSSPRALANAANAVVVSVEYRKAPENKFPASHDDVYAAYKWLTANAASINGDPKKIAVVGESAGGNMATITCLRAKAAGDPMPVAQVLVYPVANNDMNTPSYQKHANAKPLSKPMMAWFFKHETNSPADGNNPMLSPMKADVSKLPPATVITASIDPLMSEGKMYADKLKAAGVPVRYRNYEGVTHEFFGMGAVVPEAKQATQFAADGLKSAFAK